MNQMTGKQPLIDRTDCSAGMFRVGVPCESSFGQGRLYRPERTSDGWTVNNHGLTTPEAESDIDSLLAYLGSPRRVQLMIWVKQWPQNESRDLACEYIEVADGPDPDDWSAWNSWARQVSLSWLRKRGIHHHPDRTYDAHAIDLDVAFCSGYMGFWPLSRTVQLTEDLDRR
jgi:hypothetical protein